MEDAMGTKRATVWDDVSPRDAIMIKTIHAEYEGTFAGFRKYGGAYAAILVEVFPTAGASIEHVVFTSLVRQITIRRIAESQPHDCE